MKKFNVTLSGREVPVYVSDELTNLMQMRIGHNDGSRFSVFECGVDFHHGLWISTCGVWGDNLQTFIVNYFELVHSRRTSNIDYIHICDDPIYEGKVNDIVDGSIAYVYTKIDDVNSIYD